MFLMLGYVFVKPPKGYAGRTLRQGYVKRCRLVAEQKIGRYLLPNECVHHINRIKTDDRPENLAVMTTSEHSRLHACENPRRRRPNCPSGIGPCAHCDSQSHIPRKRGLCNACYLRAKRIRAKSGDWPDWAVMFPRAAEILTMAAKGKETGDDGRNRE